LVNGQIRGWVPTPGPASGRSQPNMSLTEAPTKSAAPVADKAPAKAPVKRSAARKALKELCDASGVVRKSIPDSMPHLEAVRACIRVIASTWRTSADINPEADHVYHHHDIELSGPPTVSEAVAALFDKYGRGKIFDRPEYTKRERARLESALKMFEKSKSKPSVPKKKACVPKKAVKAVPKNDK